MPCTLFCAPRVCVLHRAGRFERGQSHMADLRYAWKPLRRQWGLLWASFFVLPHFALAVVAALVRDLLASGVTDVCGVCACRVLDVCWYSNARIATEAGRRRPRLHGSIVVLCVRVIAYALRALRHGRLFFSLWSLLTGPSVVAQSVDRNTWIGAAVKHRLHKWPRRRRQQRWPTG